MVVNRAELFKPFVQLDSRLARHYEGTGLALVRHMVDLHGGSISVESTLGSGAKITVALPWRLRSLKDFVMAAEMIDERKRSESLQVADQLGYVYGGIYAGSGNLAHTARLLLVEDNEINIQTFSRYINRRNRKSPAEAGLFLLSGSIFY